MRKTSVAMPMLMIMAVRMPAMMTGTASGSSMRSSTPSRVMPMPRPASSSGRSTPSSPTIVLRSTGSSAKTASTTIDVVRPGPPMIRPITSRPYAGIACPALATVSTAGEMRRSSGRVSRMPSGTATAMTSSVDQAAMMICCWACGSSRVSQSSALRCWMTAFSRSRLW